MKKTALNKNVTALIEQQRIDEGCSPAQAIRDILTELRHICADRGLCFASIDCNAANVYEEEIYFEDCSRHEPEE